MTKYPKEVLSDYARLLRLVFPGAEMQRVQAYRDRHPERYKALRERAYSPRYHRLWNYGLLPETFELMLLEQKNRCAICAVSFDSKPVYVDHDHDSGEVRGLLCNRCNCRLGGLDDAVWAPRAIQYLLERGAK